MDQALVATVTEFLEAEFPGGRPAAGDRPLIAAIGTTAQRGLSSPLLRERIAAAGVEPAGYQPFANPAALLSDRSWTLALVLSPFKRAVGIACDALAPAAAATGVVDTLLRVEGGVLGVNTNAYAAAGAARRLLGDSGSRRVLIAGTGGAARSVAVGLRRRWPEAEVGFVGRSAESAATIVADLGFGQVVEQLEAFDADLVVNATTVGETDDATPPAFDLTAAFGPGVRYFDLNNRTSALQTAALTAGCATSSGVLMQVLTNALRAALLVARAPV